MSTRTLALASAAAGLVSWVSGALFAISVSLWQGSLGEMVPTILLWTCLGAGFLMMMLLAGYVYYDAESRGMRGALWALLIFFFASLPGFLVYLLMRTPKQRHCPNCATPVKDDYVVCPNCEAPVARACPGCGRRADPAFRVCPWCQHDLTGAGRIDRRGASPA
ncbi:MAG: zinc ribbon domain-containing protein [Candidatus Eisenbacteria bacterium]|nr:zinc ribbon domain-containing protein [Candidatus Eisenbacteria bacterium]